ncbi:MAG TPA: Flp family type IVb pilin [Isosphaeraceae bacterium]|jgi:pilus assembly protein Flp/PilA|nr:Flp family type IVb pilin [Isosphaeraceae bacterium]
MCRAYLWDFLRDESGPTAAEYAVLLALIVMAVIGTVGAIGNTTSGVWGNDTGQIVSAIGS